MSDPTAACQGQPHGHLFGSNTSGGICLDCGYDPTNRDGWPARFRLFTLRRKAKR